MNMFLLLFQDAGGGSIIWTLLPFALIFGIFYFLVILPQRRQQDEVKNMVATLKAGDEVVTNGGIIGKIKEVRETSFIIQSEKSFLEVGKSAVIGRRGEEPKK
ncbi:MAG TPA: preprotein translocase subunit YajC [Pyrinomonadaceae bacterium]|nr:preprotein translocase subunit YajC [Pyrinomonadaceae bacterium]